MASTALALVGNAWAEEIRIPTEQVARGPHDHMFGYIGRSLTIIRIHTDSIDNSNDPAK